MFSSSKKEIDLSQILKTRILKRKAMDAGLVCIFSLLRFLFFLRYRLEISNFDRVKQQLSNPERGILFLPNHPAEIDPVILMMLLWSQFRPRPLVIEHFFYIWGVRFCLKMVQALPVPSMVSSGNQWKLKQVDNLIKNVAEALKNGENFLIYPAGRLKQSGEEIVGGASLVHNLFSLCPDANVVLVRITGLWGSRFSRALTGKIPSLKLAFLDGFKVLLKNWIFFSPRRRVKIEMELATVDFPRGVSRVELNKYLEKWYNRYPSEGPESLNLVSSSFWREEFPEISDPEKQESFSAEVTVPEEIEKNIFIHLASLSHRPVDQIQRNMHLSFDLGLDSLDVANLYCFLDEQYEVNNLPHGELRTVEDLMKAALGYKLEKEESADVKSISSKWSKKKMRNIPAAPKGESIPEAFLSTCDRMQEATACCDLLSGTLTYSQLKRTVVTYALKIRNLPGKNIGILLPSSVSVNILILASMLAGKVPVMLNWRIGSHSLQKAVTLNEIEVVLSSYRFLGKLENSELDPIEKLFLFLEDFPSHIPIRKKLRGWWLSQFKAKAILSKMELEDIKENDIAAILFTSGTESSPKTVPMTHGNLLSNERAAFGSVPIRKEDILYCVLPPFHSLGFSVTGIMPLLFGIKAAYAPDPTDTYGLIDDISNLRPTIFCCAPSVIKSMLRLADPGQLKSMRLFVSGAEKTPPELFDYVSALGPQCQMIEGYGITECGPIITLVRPDFPHHKGVGQPIPGVELCIIDIETHQPLPVKEEGEVCIRGPGVFKGYLGSHPSPFIFIQEKNWYRSGDKGYLDEEGNVFLSGRLKRFVKIGGETICLTGLEEELAQIAAAKKWSNASADIPSLALGVREQNTDRPQIILFTTFDISKEEINAVLKENGFRRLVKIAEVRRLEQIPLTGTGKTHYRLLDDMIF
ncbi:MAG TPA: AMP-binding protein [Rhabdochlamydiaceae bacterium]|nr:AMP-binding protein [Rhabdochlamydiaceae bacterium]